MLAALREPATEALTRLERDLETGVERVADYYDQHCRNIAQYSDIEALRVALSHLDKTVSSVIALRAALMAGQSSLLTYSIDQRVRLALTIISRDLHEAIGRWDQAHDWYRTRLDHDDRESWDVFRVMTSDMLKGERLLRLILVRVPG